MAKSKASDLSYIAEDLRRLALPIGELALDTTNVKKHGDADVQAIAESLRRYGQRTPVVLNTNPGQLVKGNGTCMAAQLLGWSHLAVVKVTDDPTTANGYKLADNASSEIAEWDQVQLAAILEDLARDDAELVEALELADLLEEQKPKPKPKPHVAKNTGDVEWYTPPAVIEPARKVLGGFDLDPASCPAAQERIRAATFYTESEDGLALPWSGKVWLNPPYATGLVDKFVFRLLDHLRDELVSSAILLVNNATDTNWLQRAMAGAAAICFPRGRVKFLRPDGGSGSPLQGQALVYFGTEPELFIHEFQALGACW